MAKSKPPPSLDPLRPKSENPPNPDSTLSSKIGKREGIFYGSSEILAFQSRSSKIQSWNSIRKCHFVRGINWTPTCIFHSDEVLFPLAVESSRRDAIVVSLLTCPTDLGAECSDAALDDWKGEFFPDIQKIKYEGPSSKNLLSYKWYNADEEILGKKMKATSTSLLVT